MWISGATVSATRQNGGRSLSVGAFACAPGGKYSPAVTSCAVWIVVWGSDTVESLSQAIGAASAAAAQTNSMPGNNATVDSARRIVMSPLRRLLDWHATLQFVAP